MKTEDHLNHLRKVDEFRLHLKALARTQIAAGQTAAAGVLLVLETEIGSYTTMWQAFAPPLDNAPAETAPAAPAATSKHRHDFTASITKGDNPPVCACGATKNPNGRPRRQQLITPAAGGSSS